MRLAAYSHVLISADTQLFKVRAICVIVKAAVILIRLVCVAGIVLVIEPFFGLRVGY
jgi:hypothetical protein